ncbi:hypothetical protein RvY_06446-2 [Ramazzottius varieornatus]|uniref:Ig-like domain-containing protein n=1 Tax=Ramazzottius varieornatus TaxID=947166 RepID=A0A1D1V7B2_RAMVA|nr:hypothetical protein RvY_06446-2 [Ramazzottius varieornatus]
MQIRVNLFLLIQILAGHHLLVYGETQSPEALFCQKLHIYRYTLRVKDPVPIFLEATLGETLEIPCPLCIDNPKQPANWFVQRHTAKFETTPPYLVKDDNLLKLERGIYPPANTSVEEITDDPFTFDEFNRIFVQKSNNLVIRNLSVSDLGLYTCKVAATKESNGFLYYVRGLIHKDPIILPLDNETYGFTGKKSLDLAFKPRPHSPPIKIQLVHVDLVPQAWSECTSCGDIAGQQEQLLECRVKFVYPQGDQDEFRRRYAALGSEGLGNIERYLASMNRKFMADYEEKMTMVGLLRACVLTGMSDTRRFQQCQEKIYYQDDLGFKNGTSCRSLLHLNWWTYEAGKEEIIFPPPQLIGGVLRSRTCKVPCPVDESGKVVGLAAKKVKAKKFLKRRGLNLKLIRQKQKKRKTAIRKPKRHVINEFAGTSIKLSCPTAKMDNVLLWKNGTLDLNPYSIGEESGGKITYINNLVLYIRKLTKYDSQVYR